MLRSTVFFRFKQAFDCVNIRAIGQCESLKYYEVRLKPIRLIKITLTNTVTEVSED